MISTFILWLLGLQRWQKRLLQVGYDLSCAGIAFLLASAITQQGGSLASLWLGVFYAAVVALAASLLGLYRSLVRYLGVRALGVIVASCLIGGAVLLGASVLGLAALSPLFVGVAVILSGSLMAFGRLILREIFYLSRKTGRPNVVVYGAGDAGRQLLTSLAQSGSYRVVAMVDDSVQLQGAEVHGVRVYAPTDLPFLQQRFELSAVILAMPAISREQKSKVLDMLEPLGLPVRTMPRITDILSGKKSVADLQEVAIEEVLGRDPVAPNADLMRKTVTGRVVMVTGGGGSIGKELCLQIAALGPSRLVIVDAGELALYSVITALEDDERLRGLDVIPVLMSVTEQSVLTRVMQHHGVQAVFHAAAYKHVPLVEANPFQGLYNNVFGTLTTVTAAAECGVADFVLISTDKAVRPTNIMGASKRLAELICQAQAEAGQTMCVSMVRFGNVLSSSGSVIPRFKEQIAHGGPVTVTDPEITRFFMTIPEAVELVLQASGLAKGGEVFLLDMGEPVRIVDLAQRMIRLSGYRPQLPGVNGQFDSATRHQDHVIPIVFTGLRPGEKLYEELLISAESESTEHPKIFQAREHGVAWETLSNELEKLQRAIETQSIEQVHAVFSELGVDYKSAESLSADGSGAGVGVAAKAAVGGNGLGSLQRDVARRGATSGGLGVQDDEVGLVGATSGVIGAFAPGVGLAGEHEAGGLESGAVPKKINPYLSKLLHGYFLFRRPMTLGARAIVVNDKNEVMLVKHRYEPGWQLPGGGVEHGESPIEALRRELVEEAGIQMLGVSQFLGSFFNSEVSRRDHVLVYLVRDFVSVPTNEDSPEISERGFFPISDLPEGTTPGTRRRIAECFEGQAVGEVW